MKAQQITTKLSRRSASWVKRNQTLDMAFLSGDLDGYQDFLVDVTASFRKTLLVDLGNASDAKGFEWFRRRAQRLLKPETNEDLLCLGDELRNIWRKPLPHLAEPILNKWLTWVPTPQHIKLYNRLGRNTALDNELKALGTYPPPFTCDLESGRLVPDLSSLRPVLIQGILEHWKYLKICANPECVAPYFIATRKDQTVCDAEICKAEKQRQHALKWWQENRAKSKAGTEQESSKGIRKGTSKNVTQKAP